MLKLLVDGVAFTSPNAIVVELWNRIIPILAKEFDLIFLDRGMMPSFPSIRSMPFPAWRATECATQSCLLEDVAEHVEADLFISTGSTTPLRTPSLSLVFDMDRERLASASQHANRHEERTLTLHHARHRICCSLRAAADLGEMYGRLNVERTAISPVTLTLAVPDIDQVARWRSTWMLPEKYFVCVAAETGEEGVPTRLAYAVQSRTTDCVVVELNGCAARYQRFAPRRGPIREVILEPGELAACLAGAKALFLTEALEGVGLWVDAARSCGCPVIATMEETAHLPKHVANIGPGPWSPEEVWNAVRLEGQNALGDLPTDDDLSVKALALSLVEKGHQAHREAQGKAYREFADRWAFLRAQQADVEY